MDNNLFDKEKDIFNEINIPNDLDNLVNSSMKSGGRKFIIKKINKGVKIAALLVLSFIGVINISPQVASALEGVPVLGAVSKAVKFDWIQNSYDKGAYSKGVYKETIDGITFEIVEIVGDKENLRFEYEIKSKKDINKINLGFYPYRLAGSSLNYDEEHKNIISKLVKLREEEDLLRSNEDYSSEKYISITKEIAELRGQMLEIEKEILEEQLGFLEEENKRIYGIENHKYFVKSMGHTSNSIREDKSYFYLSLEENKDYLKNEGNKVSFYVDLSHGDIGQKEVTSFEVTIDLPKEVVDKFEKKVAINKTFETHFGEIEIIEATTNITTTNIISKLKDNNPNEGFSNDARLINPRLVKENGEEVLIGDHERYLSSNSLNKHSFEYSSGGEKIIFKADGVRYGSGFEKRIAIYPKDNFIKANNYGGELLNSEDNKLEVRLLNITGLELTFDDEDLSLINKEVKTIDGKEYIYLNLEVLDLNEDIVSFGTEVRNLSFPIEVELDFTR